MGGKIFRNHINFDHTHYSDAHLVSRTYLGDEGNTTPYFFIPVSVVGGCAYFLLPLNLFVVMVVASTASFYAHVFFDKEYHVEGSRLQRFAWFRRKQELHFVHHRHANSNFGVIHFFWDKILVPIEGRISAHKIGRNAPLFRCKARRPMVGLLSLVHPAQARLGRPHATGVGSIRVERSCAALDDLLRDQHLIDTIEAW